MAISYPSTPLLVIFFTHLELLLDFLVVKVEIGEGRLERVIVELAAC